MKINISLNQGQISLVRTLWELAQGRIDDLYSPEGAEEEKQAIEEQMKRVFPDNCDEFIRCESIDSKRERVDFTKLPPEIISLIDLVRNHAIKQRGFSR